MKKGGVICAAYRQKPRVCSGCGGQIDRLKKHWILKNGSFLYNTCHEDPELKKKIEPVLCSECGAQIYEGKKRWILKDGAHLCIPCYEKPRLCAGRGRQIDKGEKRWLGKDGTFLCIPCYEGRKKEEDHKKKMAGEVVKSLNYVGGFAAFTKQQVLHLRVGPTQVSVENIPLREKNRKVF
jgi:hypothetical protein